MHLQTSDSPAVLKQLSEILTLPGNVAFQPLILLHYRFCNMYLAVVAFVGGTFRKPKLQPLISYAL